MHLTTKKSSLLFAILLLTCSMLMAWDGFTDVIVNEHKKGVELSWQAKDEQDVDFYQVYRSRFGSNNFYQCYEVSAKGDGGVYYFLDIVFLPKSAETGGFKFIYFVRAVMKDESCKNSDKVQVSSNLGVSQQTWGSIKAMFR